MLPAVLFTVAMPSATVHLAGDLSFTSTHWSRSLPSNKMIASDGGALHSAPGATTLGTGCHTSVSSGFGGVDCWAQRPALIKRVITRKFGMCILIMFKSITQ